MLSSLLSCSLASACPASPISCLWMHTAASLHGSGGPEAGSAGLVSHSHVSAWLLLLLLSGGATVWEGGTLHAGCLAPFQSLFMSPTHHPQEGFAQSRILLCLLHGVAAVWCGLTFSSFLKRACNPYPPSEVCLPQSDMLCVLPRQSDTPHPVLTKEILRGA